MKREFHSKENMTRAEHEFSELIIRESGLAFYIVRFEYLVTICPELIGSEIKKIYEFLQRLSPHVRGDVRAY